MEVQQSKEGIQNNLEKLTKKQKENKMCLYPRLIQNKKYTKTKKNGGVIPAVSDKRVLAVPIGCGKCMECKKLKAREWQVRLLEEVRGEEKALFVTLTFSNESIQELYKSIHKLEGYELDNEIAN